LQVPGRPPTAVDATHGVSSLTSKQALAPRGPTLRTPTRPAHWSVTPETQRLLQHWRAHPFSSYRPFFCQVEAVETAIWLTEVAPADMRGKAFLDHLDSANHEANPGLPRLALKLSTGAGKTTVMAMLIAWQTIKAVRRRDRCTRFTRGFLVITPGLTIKDRLRVLLPNDLDSYYQGRELVPADLLADLRKAKLVITNDHAFKAPRAPRPLQGRPLAAAGPRRGLPQLEARTES
jgi:type III restriction enzyme